MPIKEGIEYGVNEALANLRSKPISTTPDLPLATRINLLKDKDPKRYQENMQRLIQAEKDGNEEARKLLGEIGEDAARNRRGYEGLNEFMMTSISGLPGVLGTYAPRIIGSVYNGYNMFDQKNPGVVTKRFNENHPILSASANILTGSLIGGMVAKGMAVSKSYDSKTNYYNDKKEALKNADKAFREWVRSPEGRRYDWSSYGSSDMETNGVRTFGQNFSPEKYKSLKFIRNLGVVPDLTSDGFVQLSPSHNALVNFTTDIPFRTHKNYSKIPGAHYLIIDANELQGYTPLSIEPMDSYFINNMKLRPNQITFLSGDEQALKMANERGFKTATNDAIKMIFNNANDEIDNLSISNKSSRIKLNKVGFGETNSAQKYKEAIDDYITEIGRPDLDDYELLEYRTGLKSGVVKNNGLAQKTRNTIDYMIDENTDFDNFVDIDGNFMYYPNGRGIDVNTRRFDPLWYKKVFYDPYTETEYKLSKSLGLPKGHPDKSKSNLFFNWMKKSNLNRM